MNNPSYFSNAQGTIIGSHANFQTVHRDSNMIANYNYQCTHGEDRMVVGGKTIRRILDSDVNYQRVLSSEVLSVSIGSGEQGLSSNGSVVRVRKMVQTAEIFQCPGTFTATTLEAVDDNDRDKVELIARRALETATSRRSALLTQLFAVVDSDPVTLVAYNELENGHRIVDRYWKKDRLIYYYLNYTYAVARQSLCNDETVTFPVTKRFEDWSLNVKTLAWHYDPASISLSPPSGRDLLPFPHRLTPLRRETLRQLDTDKIITSVEESLGDYLALVASFGGRWSLDLLRYTRYGLLTFGAIVNEYKLEILAHFPSTPSPEWFCRSQYPEVKVTLSTSVPGRVDFLFCKTGDIQVELDFGLRIPEKDRDQFGAAYLCQSLSCVDDCDDVKDLVYIDQAGFRLKGTFRDDPTTRSTPAFLIFPPLPTEMINGMHCIKYPLPRSPFYWSFDPTGKSHIAEEKWEEYNIPKLELETWIGSYWSRHQYNDVRNILSSRNYDLDGRQYARDHDHPELIRGDPHDNERLEELEELETVEGPRPSPQVTSRSTSSLVKVEPTTAPIIPTVTVFLAGWARGFLNKYYEETERESSNSASREADWDIVPCMI